MDRQSFGKNKNYFALQKKASTIQYGFWKCGTHAQVFSQTLTPVNSKKEIRQKKHTRKVGRKEWVWTKQEIPMVKL